MIENPEKFRSNQEEIDKQKEKTEEVKKEETKPVTATDEGAAEDAPSVHSSQKQE